MVGLPEFPRFNVYGEETSSGTKWNKYMCKLENLFTGLSIESKKRKKALLLHYAGDDVFDIYETLNLANNDSNYEETKQGLENYFSPRKNTEFEKYEFRNLYQQENETIDSFATRLRQKAENCQFVEKEGEIRSQIIQGCLNKKLRIKCLESEKSLADILVLARTMDAAERQAQIMDTRPTPCQINEIRRPGHPVHKQAPSIAQRTKTNLLGKTTTCRNCGGKYPHKTGKCPAYGAKCNYCHKKNHFIASTSERMCTLMKLIRIHMQVIPNQKS